ncbi:hypothetical protein M422DRAFT_268251 [Sphaerobolus stellatus SS14]|uniref:SH3 domain-containing protein n=1 Tax=Sphaerobolus stellatus (strain SS14) TaxID=990650 RepID=A0A0C9UN52_SPHS4|nr:hypothetical protein M422DRAFT_268251 [Sphaerobolus stellatus SS14]
MSGPDTPKLIRKILKKYGSPSHPSSRRKSHRTSISSGDSTETETKSASRRSSGVLGQGAAVAVAVLGRRGGGRHGGGGTFGAGGSGVYLSRDDFERNFDDLPDAESSNDNGGAYLSDEYENGDDNLDYAADQGENDGEEGEEGPLPPGIYFALFDFNPRGLRGGEMVLVEGQEVRVVGWGGSVGWAIVIREEFNASTVGKKGGKKSGKEAEEYALVPESYLKFVRGDEEDGNGEEGDE